MDKRHTRARFSQTSAKHNHYHGEDIAWKVCGMARAHKPANIRMLCTFRHPERGGLGKAHFTRTPHIHPAPIDTHTRSP